MNNKVDEYGNIYLFMTRKEMGENLKASSKTVIKIFKELEEAKLIKQENQGKGKAYKIYVVDIYSKDMEKLHIGNEKSANKVVEFLPSNNINKNINMLETIFEAREEELAFINEEDKRFMNQDKANRSKKHNFLNEKIKKIPYNLNELKNDIIKVLEDYIETVDYESYYFYKKYCLSGVKDGIKLQEELKYKYRFFLNLYLLFLELREMQRISRKCIKHPAKSPTFRQ